MKSFKAIAAMSLNRVIGREGKIPWHLPEDFKWFKRTTMGQVIVMGRLTWLSIGKALPGRVTIVLSRGGGPCAGARVERDFAAIDWQAPDLAGREVFICGGAQVYAQTLESCSDLYLTLVNRTVEGDAFFPPFEHLFAPPETLRTEPDFKILHYRRRA